MSPGRAIMTALMTSAIFAGITGLISVVMDHPLAGFAPILAAIAGFAITLVLTLLHRDEFSKLEGRG